MRQDLEKSFSEGRRYAYICPDDVCLQKQRRTFLSEVQSSDESPKSRKQAYDKWRPGSNAATHIVLSNLVKEKISFYFGTTSSSPLTGRFFEFLKKHGYRIKVLHISAPDDVRWGSIQERDKTFIQATEKDIKEKGALVPQRINDTFLKFADEIAFYYRSAVSEDAVLAATWHRNDDISKQIGTINVLDHKLYEAIKTIHNAAIEALGKVELSWENTIESVSAIL